MAARITASVADTAPMDGKMGEPLPLPSNPSTKPMAFSAPFLDLHFARALALQTSSKERSLAAQIADVRKVIELLKDVPA
jgi:hypothetical protein